jgi:hypothetical protein
LLSLHGTRPKPEGFKPDTVQLRVRHKDTHRNPANYRPAEFQPNDDRWTSVRYLSDSP